MLQSNWLLYSLSIRQYISSIAASNAIQKLINIIHEENTKEISTICR